MRRLLLLFFTFFISLSAFAQEKLTSKDYPQGEFRQPLNLPPVIAGSFGELRGNHFHSGLDYKTNQREGYPVFAVADGFVSRIRVQSVGFGNAVYITHPNGYTTVYGHLQRFNERISRTLKNYQYRIESFEVDFPLLSVEIPVKKGDIIAWSGNTGSSGGPHLHFEIRDSQTEETVNPQLFGLTIPDRVKPFITGLTLYSLNGQPFSEKTSRQNFQVSGADGSYKLTRGPLINLTGDAAFGIMTFDKNSASENQVGVYSIELLIDGKSHYASVWERFFFGDSRSINSHLDYPTLLTTGKKVQKSFVEPGNPLTLYRNLNDRGVFNFGDEEIHDVKYVIKDIAGNTSTLAFRIKNTPGVASEAKAPATAAKFLFFKDNTFDTPDFKILAPKGSLYSDLDFTYSISAKPAGAFSKLHHVHTRLIPVNAPLMIWIKPDSTLMPDLQDKALIVNTRGGAIGGSIENGFIKASARDFGDYFIKIDTVAPRISPINISDGKVLTATPRISFKISDNLSGIRSFRATIDGRWILMEYDAKRALLWHTFDENTLPGNHQLQLVVSDMKNNTSIYNAAFSR